VALLLHSSDLSQAEFSYASEGDINTAKADVLKIATNSGLKISLAVDQQTHRPISASYRLPMTNEYSGGRTQGPDKTEERASKSEALEVQIYFSEYKPIAVKGFGDIWLPFQISKTRNGQTVEDIHLKEFQLNPHLKSVQFEKKR
jgi:hypothetical protein